MALRAPLAVQRVERFEKCCGRMLQVAEHVWMMNDY